MSLRALLAADRGAGGVLALAVVGATIALSLAVLGTAAAFTTRARAAAAADAAAIAAADVLLGAAPGEPCVVARTVVAAHRVVMAGCEIQGMEALVTVRSTAFGIPIEQRARAGPPP